MDNNFSERWNTQLVEDYLQLIEDGGKSRNSPYWEGNVNYKKGNIVFDYTLEESNEILKCAKDITYFAETYCKVMTDFGVEKIKLRKYQIPILKDFTNPKERYHLLKASRQVGKCFSYVTNISIKKDNKIVSVPVGFLYYELLKKSKKLNFLEIIKYNLYKLIIKLDI